MRHLTPKHRLKAFFDKEHLMQLSNSDFYTWDSDFYTPNDKMISQRKFTSLFLCPISGIIFSSNSKGAAATTTTDGTDVYWYSSCQKAEHSASARAFNYWSKHPHEPRSFNLPIPGSCMPKIIFNEIIDEQRVLLSSQGTDMSY